jgi:MoaA/NifB/PqqE/SkfB family radical SAM enzyme
MQSLLDRLNQMEVKAISLSAEDKSLKQALKTASDYAAHLGMKLTWDLPVPYSEFNSFSHEEDEIGAATSGAGKAWLYVEPDGDVLPGQGINKVLGNLLENDWLTIWERLQ